MEIKDYELMIAGCLIESDLWQVANLGSKETTAFYRDEIMPRLKTRAVELKKEFDNFVANVGG